jgi:hypothetical protein
VDLYKSYDEAIEGEMTRVEAFYVLTGANDIDLASYPAMRSISEAVASKCAQNQSSTVVRRTAGRVDVRPASSVYSKAVNELTSEFVERRRRFEALAYKWKSSGFASLSSGAVGWKVVWSSLMCGLIWGEVAQSHQLTTTSDSTEDNALQWKLAILEGSERSRTRLEQNPLHLHHSKARDVGKSIATKGPEDVRDVEDLFVRLVRDGLIKKKSSPDEEDADVDDSFDGTADVTIDDEDGVKTGSGSPTGVRSPAAEGLLNVPESGTAESRTSILLDIVKGIVGPTEWLEGKTANVQRLCGMESYSALLIITSKTIHILR